MTLILRENFLVHFHNIFCLVDFNLLCVANGSIFIHDEIDGQCSSCTAFRQLNEEFSLITQMLKELITLQKDNIDKCVFNCRTLSPILSLTFFTWCLNCSTNRSNYVCTTGIFDLFSVSKRKRDLKSLLRVNNEVWQF